MLSADIIVVLLSVLTVVVVPLLRSFLTNIKSSIFEDTKQVVLDYYSSLDSNIDHLLESNRNVKDSLTHFKEVIDLKLTNIEKRIDSTEKRIDSNEKRIDSVEKKAVDKS